MGYVGILDNIWSVFSNRSGLQYNKLVERKMKIGLDFMLKCAIINNSNRGDVKKISPYKVTISPLLFNLRRDGVIGTLVLVAPLVFL